MSLESPALARYVARTGSVPDATWIEALDACLVRAFSERPDDRFPDASAMSEALRALLASLAPGLLRNGDPEVPSATPVGEDLGPAG